VGQASPKSRGLGKGQCSMKGSNIKLHMPKHEPVKGSLLIPTRDSKTIKDMASRSVTRDSARSKVLGIHSTRTALRHTSQRSRVKVLSHGGFQKNADAGLDAARREQ